MRDALSPMTVDDAELLTDADVAYIEANYSTLDAVCRDRSDEPAEIRDVIDAGGLPRASYVLRDGTEMFPPDYFALADAAGGPERLAAHFEERYVAAVGDIEHRYPSGLPDGWLSGLETTWRSYLAGIYGVCLREVTPENMVRKDAAVAVLEEVLGTPRPTDPAWVRRLRRATIDLDRLEREFAPDYDRTAFEMPPSRDRLVARARELYPQVFARIREPLRCEYRPRQRDGSGLEADVGTASSMGDAASADVSR
jgi:hypothetical protein